MPKRPSCSASRSANCVACEVATANWEPPPLAMAIAAGNLTTLSVMSSHAGGRAGDHQVRRLQPTAFDRDVGRGRRHPSLPAEVHRVLTAAGIPAPRRRRPLRHRRHRERYPREGMLVELDASRHAWLVAEDPGSAWSVAIDDTTGRVTWASFREQGDAQSYFEVMRETVRRLGVPTAVYADRHSIFVQISDKPSHKRSSSADERSQKDSGRQRVRIRGPVGGRQREGRARRGLSLDRFRSSSQHGALVWQAQRATTQTRVSTEPPAPTSAAS
jgi:hypothetical protein